MSAHSLALRERSVFGIPARALGLFLRSRQAWQAPVGFALVAILATVAVRRSDEQWLAQTTVLVLAPLLIACLIGASVASPFGEPERTAALPLPALRLGHMIGMVFLAAACLLTANELFPWVAAPIGWSEEWMATNTADISQALLRNLLGLTGLALIGARLVGAGLAWVAPLGFGLLSLVVRMMAEPNDAGELVLPAWALPIRSADHVWSFMASAALAVAGLVWVAWAGANDARGDEVV